MTDVFINYRRQDCPAAIGRLCDRLQAELGADRVFLDVGDIVPGADFVDALERALAGASVVLSLVGPRWLQAAAADGSRRLDDPRDFVRHEIERVLVQGTHGDPRAAGGRRDARGLRAAGAGGARHQAWRAWCWAWTLLWLALLASLGSLAG